MQWWRQETPLGTLTVVVGDDGLVRIELPTASEVDYIYERARDPAVARELDEYFAGRRQTFTLEVDLDTAGVRAPFRRTVLETLREHVPYGETVTYGELAVLAGRPGAARAVGTTMANNPVPLVIPCHRVVASNGLGGYGGGTAGLHLKRALLELEGCRVP